ncbi:MAG: TetR/AcrR family transcriptional regulator [Paracoccaceae bacterium]
MGRIAVQDRKDMILDAAFGVFAQYGYRRTVMEDIATAAGLSRTALYQHWRNKDDLFRALAQRYFDTGVQAMASALAQPGQSVEHALLAAFAAKDGKFMQAVLATPHGGELLEAGYAVTADIAEAGDTRFAEVLANWLDQLPVPAGAGAGADVAGSIMAALKGLKSSARSLAAYHAGQAALARLFARALRPD